MINKWEWSEGREENEQSPVNSYQSPYQSSVLEIKELIEEKVRAGLKRELAILEVFDMFREDVLEKLDKNIKVIKKNKYED